MELLLKCASSETVDLLHPKWIDDDPVGGGDAKDRFAPLLQGCLEDYVVGRVISKLFLR